MALLMSIAPHKSFVPYDTHTNFCFAKTSFMLELLGEISFKNEGIK
jgi:hypothetical protein